MRLVFVGHRCCDHSESSGYDQICSIFPDAGWLDGRSLGAGELEWIRRPKSAEPPDLFHVFYGDCSGSALPAILRDRFPEAIVVATAHQPISRLQHDPQGWAGLQAVDAVITVSHEQVRHLARLGLRCPVYPLHHGVWTRAFRPADPGAPRSSVVMVGTYLRDWDSARRIVELLAASGVRTDLVGSGDRLAVDHPLVTRHERVSETELAHLYQRAAALVLPVLDATACNALLEAMAAGCPVVCPRLESLVDEYLGDGADAYPAGDHAAAVARATRLVQDPEYRSARSTRLLARVERFDWECLRPHFVETYRRIKARWRRTVRRSSVERESAAIVVTQSSG